MYNKNHFYLVFLLVGCFHCSFSYGNQCEIAEVCVTDLTEANCAPTEYLKPGSSIFGCCPSCQPKPGEIPGCRPPANCLPDGRYAPVQCKGDHFIGRCFCSDENGNRIFGQMWRGEANDMTCACSRRRSELLAEGRTDVTLHCTRTGDYELLQCDSGLCWCVETSSGQPIATPVQQENMSRLPCYSSNQLGEQYLRRCESIVHATATIHREQSEHGTHFLGSPNTFCDYDGSYSSIQIVNGIAYCTGRDGSILGAWQRTVATMANMNCNCARDTAVYFPERGMTVSEVCQENGNYRPYQQAGDRYYCVDTDGYMTSEGLMDELPDPDYCSRYA